MINQLIDEVVIVLLAIDMLVLFSSFVNTHADIL